MITEKKFNDLTIYKYHRKVFRKNLWHEDPMLVESRGLIRDAQGAIVQYPFTKTFNLGENGTYVSPETYVVCPRKVNGFMAAVTWHSGELLVSTTGSLDSPFIEMAKEKLAEVPGLEDLCAETFYSTWLFEIVHEDDPHIVSEEPGAYLIGSRFKELGSKYVSEHRLDAIAEFIGAKRAATWVGYFKDLPLDVEHEGWMVRSHETGDILCKIKSKHYLVKKFLMRSKKAYDVKEVEEEFFDLIKQIRQDYTKEEWNALGEQNRRAYIEAYYRD